MPKKFVHVKVKYEDWMRRIEATVAKEEAHQLVVYNGEDVSGRFSLDKVEQWSLEEDAY